MPVNGTYTIEASTEANSTHERGWNVSVISTSKLVPVITVEVVTEGPYYANMPITIKTYIDGVESGLVNVTVNGTELGYGRSYTIPENGTFVINASTVANSTHEAGFGFAVITTSKHVPVVTIEIITSGPYYAGMDVEFRTLIDGVVSTAVNVTVNGTKVDGRSYRLPVNGTSTF